MKYALLVLATLTWSSPLTAAYVETMNPQGPKKNLQQDFGLVDDNAKSNQSEKLQKAIDTIADQGGGILVLPKGTYRFSGIYLKSNVHLLVEKDTVIKPWWPAGEKAVVFTLGVPGRTGKGYIENVSIRGHGDKIALLSRETILPLFQSTVEKIRVLNERRFVMRLAEVPDEFPEGPLSAENLSWYPDLIMRNNTIRENRARSVLVTTQGKVLIEDNYFSSQMHGILIEGDNNKWYESGAVKDVTIRNNVFENVGYEVTKRYPLLASPLYTPEQRMGEGQYHRNITFTRGGWALVAYFPRQMLKNTVPSFASKTRRPRM